MQASAERGSAELQAVQVMRAEVTHYPLFQLLTESFPKGRGLPQTDTTLLYDAQAPEKAPAPQGKMHKHGFNISVCFPDNFPYSWVSKPVKVLRGCGITACKR